MIRQAAIRDYEQINAIKAALLLDSTNIHEPNYRVATEQSGFLLYKDTQTKEAFEQDLKKIFFVYEEEGQVKGYLRVDEEQEMDKNIQALWFKPELQELYFSKPHAATGGVALLPGTAKKGIGKELLTASIAEVKKKNILYLFAFVALSPLTNIASLLFHERNGFERIACADVPELFGFKNYQSLLYGKQL